jgi:hypothetical protein
MGGGFGSGMGGGYSVFGGSGYGSQGGNMYGLDPNAIAADPQGFSRWNQQRQQQQGGMGGGMGGSGGGGGILGQLASQIQQPQSQPQEQAQPNVTISAPQPNAPQPQFTTTPGQQAPQTSSPTPYMQNRDRYNSNPDYNSFNGMSGRSFHLNQGGLASTEIRHFDEGGSSDHAGWGSRDAGGNTGAGASNSRENGSWGSRDAGGNTGFSAPSGGGGGGGNNVSNRSSAGERPNYTPSDPSLSTPPVPESMISKDYKAGNGQFFQPIYRGQYENYANPAIANSVSSYGTGPQQSFRMPTTFNPFSTFGGQGQQFQVPQFQVPQFQVPQFQVPQFQPMMPQYEGGIASLVNK